MGEPTTIIALLLIGVASLVGYFKAIEKKKRIIENGVEADGIVFDFSEDNEVSTDINSPNAAMPLIRFVTKEGLWMTGKGEWSLTTLKQGDKVTVIYNPENPKEFIYRTSMDWGGILIYLFLVAGIVCLGIGLWFAYQYLSKTV
jgi:hypothetical protein